MLRSLLLSCLSLPWVLSLSEPQDLSHSYDNTTLYWASSTPFSFTKVVTAPLDQWYAVNEFQTAEHGGTHLDAPYHFNYNGWQVGDIPLHRLIGRAVMVDLRQKASNDSDYQASVEDFEEWEEQHGPIPDGAVVIMDFGWTSKYKNASEYFGTPFTNNTELYHFPGLSEAGAQWLVNTGKVFGVGTDTASIDYGQTKDFKAHKVLSAHNIYNLEHLALPSTPLPSSGYQLLSLPIKIRHGTGGPVRVVALPYVASSATPTSPFAALVYFCTTCLLIFVKHLQ